MRVKLVQLDGALPNMAIMRLSHFFKHRRSAEVVFTNRVDRDMFEEPFDLVLASQIFSDSYKRASQLLSLYPEAVIRGTGTSSTETLEDFDAELLEYRKLDYSIYPSFEQSLGMTQIGCSSKCPFCCVPTKEGANRAVSNIADIYRGEPHPRQLVLIDNDFQSRPRWQEICEEIIEGNFEVAFIQGINIRKLTDEHAIYFKQMKFRDRKFSQKRFYCAWDNEKDFKRIERGIAILEKAGIVRRAITPYFLCNFWQKGLTEDVWRRFEQMMIWGLRPYAMIYQKDLLPARDDLKIFQNWVNSHNAYKDPTRSGFESYKRYYLNYHINAKKPEGTQSLFADDE